MIPYRDENPTRSFPFVTITFLVANVLIFLWSLSQGDFEATVCRWGAVAAELTGSTPEANAAACARLNAGPIPTVFSHMFMHGGFLHLGGNMLYLWIFGNNIEDILGHGRFVFFYLLSGFGALFLQVFANADASVPMVGASGAIAGILGAYLVLFPLARISVIVPIFFFITTMQVPAFFMLLFWFLLQVGNSMLDSSSPVGGGVAWYAHIGGFIAGLLLILLIPKKRKVPRRR